jgi:hypothetical protein
MLRHMLVLTVFTLGSLQGFAHAASFPGGSEGGAPLNLEQGHPGQEPGASADIAIRVFRPLRPAPEESFMPVPSAWAFFAAPIVAGPGPQPTRD